MCGQLQRRDQGVYLQRLSAPGGVSFAAVDSKPCIAGTRARRIGNKHQIAAINPWPCSTSHGFSQHDLFYQTKARCSAAFHATWTPYAANTPARQSNPAVRPWHEDCAKQQAIVGPGVNVCSSAATENQKNSFELNLCASSKRPTL